MRCHVCGGQMKEIQTDLPFKLDDHKILVMKSVPVEQCSFCGEFLISDQVMEVLDNIFESTDKAVEIEVRRYAA
ncbi:MAG TPA: YgiT-type zinc finger protein [Desulfosalsimonadaceae bacterium]|nr:YgiT-type zinc finger protein [Desulfosalsimonadaceae bacterium]